MKQTIEKQGLGVKVPNHVMSGYEDIWAESFEFACEEDGRRSRGGAYPASVIKAATKIANGMVCTAFLKAARINAKAVREREDSDGYDSLPGAAEDARTSMAAAKKAVR